jgi:hypothetical protein
MNIDLTADAEVVVLLRHCPSGSAPFPFQHYLETKIGTGICASKVRVVPPSKSSLKRIRTCGPTAGMRPFRKRVAWVF